jgi:3',5'-cyclic AMP phosphodiesterase CpdA
MMAQAAAAPPRAPLTILQLSDIHFGPEHAFRIPKGDPNHAEVSFVEAVTAGLELDKAPPVDVLVISGDIVTHGAWKELRGVARDALDQLCKKLNLPKERVFIIPGNHDYEWYAPDAQRGMLRQILQTDEAPKDIAFGHEVQFRYFMKEFYGAEWDYQGTVHTIDANGFRLKIGLLDSCKINPAGFREYGCVTNAQIKLLKSNFDKDVQGEEVRLVVLHHHVSPIIPADAPRDDTNVSVTLDAGRLIDMMLQANVGIVLHGHQHYPSVSRISKSRFAGRDLQPLPERNINVVSGGSAGVNSNRRPAEVPNTYTLISLDRDKADVQIRAIFAQGDDASTLRGFPLQLR